MKAYGYMVSLIDLLQRKFALYSIITPGEFDVLYRWWEKGIPLTVVEQAADEVVTRRKKQGKEPPKITHFAHTVRKLFAQHQEKIVGAHNLTEDPSAGAKARNHFLSNPPVEIADLVREHLHADSQDSLNCEQIVCFQQALLDRFQDDEELARRCEVFSRYLAPALRSDELLNRYRLNLLLNRLAIPDLESEGEEAS